MLQLTQQFAFINDALNTFLLNYSALGHLLHGVDGFKLTTFDLPDFAKAPLADDRDELEMVFVDGARPFLRRVKLNVAISHD